MKEIKITKTISAQFDRNGHTYTFYAIEKPSICMLEGDQVHEETFTTIYMQNEKDDTLVPCFSLTGGFNEEQVLTVMNIFAKASIEEYERCDLADDYEEYDDTLLDICDFCEDSDDCCEACSELIDAIDEVLDSLESEDDETCMLIELDLDEDGVQGLIAFMREDDEDAEEDESEA